MSARWARPSAARAALANGPTHAHSSAATGATGRPRVPKASTAIRTRDPSNAGRKLRTAGRTTARTTVRRKAARARALTSRQTTDSKTVRIRGKTTGLRAVPTIAVTSGKTHGSTIERATRKANVRSTERPSSARHVPARPR